MFATNNVKVASAETAKNTGAKYEHNEIELCEGGDKDKDEEAVKVPSSDVTDRVSIKQVTLVNGTHIDK